MPFNFFVLRPEHDAAFAAAGILRFQRKAVRWLERDFAEFPIPSSEELLISVKRWTSHVRPNGLLTERQMYAFFCTGLALQLSGEDILKSTPIQQILRGRMTSEQKAEAIRAIRSQNPRQLPKK